MTMKPTKHSLNDRLAVLLIAGSAEAAGDLERAFRQPPRECAQERLQINISTVAHRRFADT
jgi:hypothetical protein